MICLRVLAERFKFCRRLGALPLANFFGRARVGESKV